MSSNDNSTSNDNNNNNNNGGGSNSSDLLSIVALVISVIALIASVLQVMQQYFASAAGYANCNEEVMGKWHRSKKRILRPTEFRFEVQFAAPVIFLCPPTNKNGPVKNQPIHFLDGTEASLENTWTDLDPDKKPQPNVKKTEKDTIHTADNERATWVTLLSALQRMEHDSRKWQRDMYEKGPNSPPRSDLDDRPLNANKTKELLSRVEAQYSLTTAVQKKKRSWDTMPAGVRRPYATTTMCHMVEMAAILGVYWSEFDRKLDRYRAEGNGFIIMGEKVPDLGIMFSFQVYGKNRFEENRIIPIDEVKELCFGFVPTLYRETSDNRRLAYPNDEPRDLSALQLASRPEIAETLVLIGCNTNTVNYFLNPHSRDSHLFSIVFEILGMLGRNLHIEDSCFRLLPNPTLYRWDRKNFSLPKMLSAYRTLVDEPHVLQNPQSIVLTRIKYHIRRLQAQLDAPGELPGAWPGLPLLKALHQALDDLDEVLTAKKKPKKPDPPALAAAADRVGTNRLLHERQGSQNKLLDLALLPTSTAGGRDKSPSGRTTTPSPAPPAEKEKPKEPRERPRETERRQIVQDVLRAHLQEVLSLMNSKTDGDEPASATAATFVVMGRQPRFEDIDAAAPEEKQNKFMEVYFKVVRKRVVEQSSTSTQRRLSVAQNPAMPPLVRRQGTGLTQVSIAEGDETAAEDTEGSKDTTTAVVAEEEEEEERSMRPLWELPDVSHEDIWCTLVFRMMCWLMLHDFHKKDVQISKSELLGSRLPVYIA